MMGFFDRFKKAIDSEKNDSSNERGFRHLDELIHSGSKEIVLDSDIVLAGGEAKSYANGIKIDVDNIVLDGNMHTIDAKNSTEIFCISAKNVTIKNLKLKNGYSETQSILKVFPESGVLLSGCEVSNNSNNSHTIVGDELVCIGTVIQNNGDLTIQDSTISDNSSRGQGGAIRNNRTLSISNSHIKHNKSMENGGAIYNEGVLRASNSKFEHNESDRIGGAIHNAFGADLIIENSQFNENRKKESLNDISNSFNLVLKDMHSDPKIFNEWTVFVEKGKSFDIDNHGGTIEFGPLDGNEKSFTFLNDLLEQKGTHIDLTHDIRLDILNDEQLDFPDGIKITEDDLTIDGNGHSIDGMRMRNIFTTEGKNIVIKNMNLERGFSKLSNGAAISVKSGSLMIEESKFINNAAYNGGAVSVKDASVLIRASRFIFNVANALRLATGGGAIYNESGSLTITDSTFEMNSSPWGEGGAILNGKGTLSIAKSDFIDNRSVKNGNDISNYDLLRICECSFKGAKTSIFNNNLSKVYDSNFNSSLIENRGLLKMDNEFPISNAQIRNSGKVKAYNFNDRTIESVDVSNDDRGELAFVIDGVEVFSTTEIAQRWIGIKVFISSTFKDMHSERDYLITEVFPELSKWCKERRILLTEVDLRWGITREDSKSGNTINICLQYIDKCKPFFICFLGQRRGWVPQDGEREVTEETFKNFPTVNDLIGHLSITEMEIEHATTLPLFKLLENEFDNEHAKKALFFLRENPFEDVELTPAQKSIYLNMNPDDDEKLSELKDLIREKCLFFEYSCRWDENLEVYELSSSVPEKGGLTDFTCNGKPLSQTIITEVKKQIEKEYPEYKPVKTDDIFLEDAMLQNLEITSISNDFVGNQKEIDYITEFIESNSERLLLVSGPEGSGKSTLLCKAHALLNERGVKSVMRIANATAKSDSHSHIYLSIGSEIGLFNGEETLYKGGHHTIDDEFLQKLSERGIKVLIISNADKLSGEWDIKSIPDGFHIIISCGESHQIALPHSELAIEGFEDIEEREVLVSNYLNRILKNLNQEQRELITSNPASKSPLFLKILLNEIKNYGSYEDLNEKIARFGDSTLTAFKELLYTLENDATFRNGFARDTLILMNHSKHGLTEDELAFGLEKLGHGDAKSKLRLFFYRMDDYVLDIEDKHLIKFDELKKAIGETYDDFKEKSRRTLVEIYKHNILNSPDSLSNGSDEILYNLELLKDYGEIINIFKDDTLLDGISPDCYFLGYKYGKFYGRNRQYLGFTMEKTKEGYELFREIALVLAEKSADSMHYAVRKYPHPHTQWPRKFINENDTESFGKYQDAFYAIPMLIKAACTYAAKGFDENMDSDELMKFKSSFDESISVVESFLDYMSKFGSSQLDLGYKVEALADDAIFALDRLNDKYKS